MTEANEGLAGGMFFVDRGVFFGIRTHILALRPLFGCDKPKKSVRFKTRRSKVRLISEYLLYLVMLPGVK